MRSCGLMRRVLILLNWIVQFHRNQPLVAFTIPNNPSHYECYCLFIFRCPYIWNSTKLNYWRFVGKEEIQIATMANIPKNLTFIGLLFFILALTVVMCGKVPINKRVKQTFPLELLHFLPVSLAFVVNAFRTCNNKCTCLSFSDFLEHDYFVFAEASCTVSSYF